MCTWYSFCDIKCVHVIHCYRRQSEGEEINQERRNMDKAGLSKPINKLSDKSPKKGKVGNPLFGNIDPVKLFETLVKNNVLKGILQCI